MKHKQLIYSSHNVGEWCEEKVNPMELRTATVTEVNIGYLLDILNTVWLALFNLHKI